jgi:hypothetical protein
MPSINDMTHAESEIPNDIAEMSDAEINDWAVDVYEKFTSLTPDTWSKDEKGGQEWESPHTWSSPPMIADWDLGPDHPTQGRRYDNVHSLFMDLAKKNDLEVIEVDPDMADFDVLTRVHSPAYVKSVIEDGMFLDFPYPNAIGPMIARIFVAATLDGLSALIDGIGLLSWGLRCGSPVDSGRPPW